MPRLASPEFWARDGFLARLLGPLGLAYGALAAARRHATSADRAPVPVVCVGNLVAGGAGKTPVAAAIARMLAAAGRRPHVVSRGYGGRLAGPVAVDPMRHDAADVGDEPLLLAGVAPTWVARDRVAGALAAAAAGAGVVVLDDGFQNPHLRKDLSLLVVDGGYGLGNGRVHPAGPLREPVAAALARTDAVVLMGEDETGVAARLGAVPVLHATLEPVAPQRFRDRRAVAFAGIGRPEKFFRTLAAAGAIVVARHGFPDHHRYGETELARLAAEADETGAALVTTEKDLQRLAPAWRARVATLAVAIAWADEARLEAMLERLPWAEVPRG